MESTKALHMKGGTGDKSYSNNSSLQRKSITNAMTIMGEAIKDVYFRLHPKTFCISDMGCSTGPNIFYSISLLMEAVDSVCRSLDRDSPEFLIHLNDLPTNDFNTIFRSFPLYKEKCKGSGLGSCFLTGVPGSFYERLLTSESQHFIISSNSLHWLSQAPEEENKGNIHISITSPPEVVIAYNLQFKKDFSIFLRYRAVELVDDGSMVLIFLGRRDEDPRTWESQDILGPLSMVFIDMVNEGLVDKEKLSSFNIPMYKPSVTELKAVVEEEGSFTINHLELNDLHLQEDNKSTPEFFENVGLLAAKVLRAIFEPLFASYFGEDMMDEVFNRLAKIYTHCMSKGIECVGLNFTLFLTKKL